MAFKKPKTKGLAGATAMVKELEFLTSANIGADFIADQARSQTVQSRDKGTMKKGSVPTHEQVLEYLAEQGRSLYPNDKDSIEAGRMVRDSISEHLKRTGQTVTNKKGVSRVLTADRQAMAGASSGLMKGAKYIAKTMTARIKSQSTTDGGKAEPVTESYANWRHSNYDVAQSVVYVASGQLANAIASGKVKVFMKDANIGALLKNI